MKKIIILLTVVLIVIGGFTVYKNFSDGHRTVMGDLTEATSETTTETTSETTTETTTEPTTEATTHKINEETGRIVVDPEQELWSLVVVNITREMPADYTPELKEIGSTGKYLHHLVAPYYEKMYNAAKEEGFILTPYSAYRSYSRQDTNYKSLTESYMTQYNISREEAAAKAATVILPPGTSEHNLGLAVDIKGTESTFAETPEYQWLVENAHKYGFILRYTEEKQDITGIIPEPWHWRFVGVEYAEDIKNSGLCLEEYLELKGIEF